MVFSPLIDQLIRALQCLPGVGPKSAQRMTLQLLNHKRESARNLAVLLERAMEKVGHCSSCRTLSEEPLCRLCSDPTRDQSLLCVVEQTSDVVAIEQTGGYSGRYFVLLGHLSPIDGMGPEEIGISELLESITEEVKEVILATNPTIEGEATSEYIAAKLRAKKQVQVSRIAHGVPVGGELEFVDGSTLVHALSDRKLVSLNLKDVQDT